LTFVIHPIKPIEQASRLPQGLLDGFGKIKMQKSYRFLSGVDDAAFCQRVSDVLAEGYVLYGNPVMVMDNGSRIVGQAVILPDVANGHDAADRNSSRD
jgi:hypothetical protein